MDDNQFNRENDVRGLVRAAEPIARAVAKTLYHAASQSALEAEPLTRLAEAIENALSDYLPNDSAWAEKIQTARNS